LQIFQKCKDMALTPPALQAFAMPSTVRPESDSNAPILTYKRPRTQIAPKKVQDTVENIHDNRLSKYVIRDSNLLTKLGWEQVVKSKRQWGDFGHLQIRHPVQCFLCYLRSRGVPVAITTTPWDDARIYAAVIRGPHKLARDHRAFLHTEMADMVNKNQ
jgi:hypothetical protein